MPALVNLGDTEIMTAVRAVLLHLLPPGVEVIRAYGNRVPQPVTPDFCVLSELRRERLSTNRDKDTDIRLVGGIDGETLVVTSGPALLPGYTLYGAAVIAGSVVTGTLEQPGAYTVTPPQVVPAGSRIFAGRHAMLQPVDVVYQCDVHGLDSNRHAWAIHTTWRGSNAEVPGRAPASGGGVLAIRHDAALRRGPAHGPVRQRRIPVGGPLGRRPAYPGQSRRLARPGVRCRSACAG